jgi:hypothetical protein
MSRTRAKGKYLMHNHMPFYQTIYENVEKPIIANTNVNKVN